MHCAVRPKRSLQQLRLLLNNYLFFSTGATRDVGAAAGTIAKAVHKQGGLAQAEPSGKPCRNSTQLDAAAAFKKSGFMGSEHLFVTANTSTDGLVPVGKLLAARGVCSRGEGDEFFSLGLVLLNGRRLERNQAYVHPDAPLQLAPRAQRLLQQKVTVILHKPMHFLCCRTDKQVSVIHTLAFGPVAHLRQI